MEKLKKRHGCLTAWLVVLIILNTFSILSSVITYFFFDPEMFQMPGMPAIDLPTWLIAAGALYAVICLIFTIALFMWRKWAFWGYIGVNMLYIAIIMLAGRPFLEIIYGLISSVIVIVILFGVLQIGGDENKGWKQLE